MLQFGHGTAAVDDLPLLVMAWDAMPGFNSATALLPWMTSLWWTNANDRQKASIRPRHCCRG